MGFDRDSGKLWRRLGTICVIAAVLLSLWSRWVALALAGFGLGIGVPLWSRRPWRDLLESAGLLVLRLPGAVIRSPASRKGGQSEWLPSREGDARHATFRGPVGTAQEAWAEATLSLPFSSFHTLSLGARSTGAEEATLRPQNSFRLAAVGVPARSGREKSIHRVEPEEVISLPSILGNMEKRYRGKRPAGSAQASQEHRAEAPPVPIYMEEIRRRLRAAYGGQLPGGIREASSCPAGESLQGAVSCACDERIDDPVARLATPAWSRVREKTIRETVRGCRPAYPSGSSPEVRVDDAGCGPRVRHSEQSVEGAAHPLKTGPLPPPVTLSGRTPAVGDSMAATGFYDGVRGGTAPGRDLDIGVAEHASTPMPPCEPAVKPAGPFIPCAPGNGGNPFRPEFYGDASLPPLSLLRPAGSAVAPMSQDDLIDGGILIEEKLAEFRVKVNVQDAYAGPVITRYEVQPAVGVRGGQVMSLMKDLARALGVASIRMVETIPGKTCMGLELPNPRRQMIQLSEVLSSEVFQSHASKLAMALGKDITGEPVVVDLAKAPHMLVAGTTGSGKSVGVNAMILSLLYRATPNEVRFVMIDPKMLELSIYDGIPHLLAPVVTDMKLAANALNWCVGEMERRYRLMSGLQVRNLAGYNQKVRDGIDAGEPLADPFPLTQDNPAPLSPLPYVVVVIDELADLMMVAGKKVEELIARLAQKARAAGIHLIIATQRPSVDVITGLIKANIPTRIAFQVSSKIDSRTILDQMGAECLLGQGDMLYLPPGTGYPQRVHGAFVADEEVYAVAEHLKQLGEPQYVEGVLGGPADAEDGGTEVERSGEEADPLYDDAVAFVIRSRRASISAVQRQLRIGYNRAARLVEQMEASGLVSSMESNGNRTVLAPAGPE